MLTSLLTRHRPTTRTAANRVVPLGGLVAGVLLAASLPLASSAAPGTPAGPEGFGTDGRSVEGELRWARDWDCVSLTTPSPYRTNTLGSYVSQESARQIPDVGEVFRVRLVSASVGWNCTDGVVLPEFIPPRGVVAAVSKKHPVRWRRAMVNGAGMTAWSSTGTRVNGPRPGDGSLTVTDQSGALIQVPNGSQVQIEVPFVATRTLRGIAAGAPSCPGADTQFKACTPADAADHLQVKLTHNQGAPRPMTVSVAMFANPRVAPARVSVRAKDRKARSLGKWRRQGLAVKTSPGAKVAAKIRAGKVTRTVKVKAGANGKVKVKLPLKGKLKRAAARSGKVKVTLSARYPGGPAAEKRSVTLKIRG